MTRDEVRPCPAYDCCIAHNALLRSGIGTRDVKLRDHLERTHGQPATVDPTRFVSSEPPTIAAAEPTQQLDPLGLWNWDGADGTGNGGWNGAAASTDGASPSGVSGYASILGEVEWDGSFLDGVTVSPSMVESSPSSGTSVSPGGSSAIGGAEYIVGNEPELPPAFWEVGKPSEIASSPMKNGSAEAPKGGTGGGSAGRGISSDHASSDYHTTTNEVRRIRRCFVGPAKLYARSHLFCPFMW